MYLFTSDTPLLLQAPVTAIIVGITVLISFLAFSNQELLGRFIFNPDIIHQHNQWYRFFTHGLIHKDGIHLAMNMFVLWEFGKVIEMSYQLLFEDKGIILYIALYILGLPMASLYSYYRHKNDPYYFALGASGAVSGIVFAFILIAPTEKMMLMFLPIPIPAFILGGLYLIYSQVMSRRNSDNIGHDAHFWGSVWGFAFTALLKPALVMHFFSQILNW